MSYDDKEVNDWWAEHGDEVEPVIEDEINGDDVVSYDDVVDTDDEPSCDPFGTEDDD